MKLFIDIVIKRIYLFNTVAWYYRKKIGFPVCKKENFAGLQAHRKLGESACASPTPHQTLNEERSARFTAQHLSALGGTVEWNHPSPKSRNGGKSTHILKRVILKKNKEIKRRKYGEREYECWRDEFYCHHSFSSLFFFYLPFELKLSRHPDSSISNNEME